MDTTHNQHLRNYYRYHSPLYDATRWSFLFGRKALVEAIPELPDNPTVMEVGCGTGYNLLNLSRRFPDARITGIDLSPDMLAVARKKVKDHPNIRLRECTFGGNRSVAPPADLILLSYSLTMIGAEVTDVIKGIKQHLKQDGYVAIVDFHSSPIGWFRRWMKRNHVDFSGQILPQLHSHFAVKRLYPEQAYLGLWKYFRFIGQL